MRNKQHMTFIALETLVGKTIKWSAPSAKENRPYSGIDKIISIDLKDRTPLKTEVIEGDDLSFAFVDDMMKNEFLSYSDSYRVVSFEIIEPSNKVKFMS
jgi:hypothetical protein